MVWVECVCPIGCPLLYANKKQLFCHHFIETFIGCNIKDYILQFLYVWNDILERLRTTSIKWNQMVGGNQSL